MDQNQIMQIQMMEQEGNQLNEQMCLIDQNITEMNELNESLEEIDKGDSKDMLANLGKKIFIPVEIKDKNLIVEVGRGNFVKKSISDTKKVIEDQISRLSEGKGQIMSRLEELQGEMIKLIGEFERSRESEGVNSEDESKE